MKYDPINRKLYTSHGAYLKTLHCPWNVRWSDLQKSDGSHDPLCNFCQNRIHTTDGKSDNEVRDLISSDGGVCLHIDPSQSNVEII